MRIGVLGTMVWDRIDHTDSPPVERWGGISYSLAAASAGLPEGWTVRPIIRLGADLAARAYAFFDSLPGLERPGWVREVAEPNNRVHLRYQDAGHREEILTGGVGPWSWDALEPALDGLDALFVNLISGFELELGTAQRLRDAVDGPLYADLHSLLLDVGADGRRVPRALPRRDEWLDAFDLVQMNEREAGLVAGPDDPGDVARAAVRRGRGAVFVTRGSRGIAWYAASNRPRPWERRPERDAGEAEVPERLAVGQPGPGDPTGCGDVWGAVCFLALLSGRRLGEAVGVASRAAAANLEHRGAEGLRDHLRAVIGPQDPRRDA